MIKKVVRDSQEVRIATYFSSAALRDDPRNHCVPVLDVLDDLEDPSLSFMIMPFLRRIHDVEFDTVGSIFDCVGQLLEVSSFDQLLSSGAHGATQGLLFLHENNVAHR